MVITDSNGEVLVTNVSITLVSDGLTVRLAGETFVHYWNPRERVPYLGYQIDKAWSIIGEMIALYFEGKYNEQSKIDVLKR